MKVVKMSLREIMEDDNSPYMKHLTAEFERLHGAKLESIITESMKLGRPVAAPQKRKRKP